MGCVLNLAKVKDNLKNLNASVFIFRNMFSVEKYSNRIVLFMKNKKL